MVRDGRTDTESKRASTADSWQRSVEAKWKSSRGPSKNRSYDNRLRKLRGIYFIDRQHPEEFKEIMKNARRKLEVPMPAATPCTTVNVVRKGKLVAQLDRTQDKIRIHCSSLRILRKSVWKDLFIKVMKIILQGEGSLFIEPLKSCAQNSIPMPQAMQIPDAKVQQWIKNGKTLIQIPAWQLTKVRNEKEVIAEARKEGKIADVALLMDICQRQQCWSWIQNFRNMKSHSRTPTVTVREKWFRDNLIHSRLRSKVLSASQMTAAKVMDVRSRARSRLHAGH